ncbi:MAG: GNAT family N-acetyltransferase [Ruminococcus sp.]|nr:GNAT family N-acetyltransferase [Ruminococcus sp.]
MDTLNLIGSQPIETEHFILRPIKETDAEAMYANWASSPAVAEYVTWNAHENVEVSRHLCRTWEERAKNIDFFHWTLVLKSIGEPIGTIGAVSIDIDKKSAEIGYCMGNKWWNKGYMTECLGAVTEYLFDKIGFEEITAYHDIDNPASGKVMKKCGMKFICSKEKTVKGLERTVLYYSLKKTEWDEIRPK